MRNSGEEERSFGVNRRMLCFLGLCVAVLPFLIGCGESDSSSSASRATPEPPRLVRILCTIYKGVSDDGTKIVDGSPMEVLLPAREVQTHEIDVNRGGAGKFPEGKWEGAGSKSTEAFVCIRPDQGWERTD